MYSLASIRSRFKRAFFFKNAMWTIVIEWKGRTPKVLASLVHHGKNNYRTSYTSKSDYINYLDSE